MIKINYGGLIFLGSFLGVVICICVAFSVIRNKICSTIGNPYQLINMLKDSGNMVDEQPKSLNGADSIFLPLILKDFPDFNVTLAKTYAKNRIEKEFYGVTGLLVHNTVISDYRSARLEKTVVFQTAFQYVQSGTTVQKRYCLHYSFLIGEDGGESTVASNCPNCGGVVENTYQTQCLFCGSKLTNVMGGEWSFTEVYEQ